MDNLLNEKYLILENEDVLPEKTPEQIFEEKMGIPFDPNRFEIVYNDDAYSDGFDAPVSTFNVIEKRLIKEKKVLENEDVLPEKTPEQIFEEKMGIPFDPNRFKIVYNDDAYSDGFDAPVSTFDVIERIPVEKVVLKENEHYIGKETNEEAFQRIMEIPFDSEMYKITPNDDAYSDGFDAPVSTFNIEMIKPIDVVKGRLVEDAPAKVDSNQNINKVNNKEKKNEDSSDTDQTGDASTSDEEKKNEDEPDINKSDDNIDQNDNPEDKKEEKEDKSDINKPDDNINQDANKINLNDDLDEFERSFVEDANADGLQPGDPEFDQMLKERNINRDKILNYYEKEAKRKERELYDNLSDLEKAFVDDAKAEGLNPKDPEFDQMLKERAGINKDKILNYYGISSDKVNKDKTDENFDNLNDEQIKEKIAELEAKRKEIDSKIVKIDLNPNSWDGTPELMDEYVKLGKQIDKLKGMLPEEIKNKDESKKEEKAPVVEKEVKNKKNTKDADRQKELKKLKEKKNLLYKLKNLLKSKKKNKQQLNDLGEEDIKKLGFASIILVSFVSIIMGILLMLIIKLI